MAPVAVPSGYDRRDGERFVHEIDHRLERLDRAVLNADWNLFTGRSRHGSAAWQRRRSALLRDDRILAWVRGALGRPWTFPVTRRLELLERILLDARVEQSDEVIERRSDLQQRIVAYRPLWKGRRVNRAVLFQVLWRGPKEADRRAAYYALEPLHRPLEDSMVELVRLRNDRARSLGYRTFAEMRLGFQGLTAARLEELADGASAALVHRLRLVRSRFAESTGQSTWSPWDFPYARSERVPLPDRLFPRAAMLPRILKAVGQWGFRTERMHFRTVLHDVPSGGLTLAPDPPRDVRILVHPRGGWSAYMIMFHEVGHAVHSSQVRAPRHLLRWSENIPGTGAFHEGIGGLFEEIPSTEEWLTTVPGLGSKRAADFARSAHEYGKVDAAGHACWLRIEQELYRNPDRNPMPAVHRFERRVFGYDEFEPLSFVDSFFVDDPVYASNYLLAMLFDAQVGRTVRQLFGEPFWPNRHVGPWLTRYWFAPGSLYDWIPRLKETTGHRFGIEAFRAEVRAG